MGSSLIQPDPGTILWTLITFVILAALLRVFAWKPLLQILAEREASIKGALEQAQQARVEAEEILRQNREALQNARRETAAIIEQGKREAESLKEEILAAARRDAQELVEQGQRQVRMEQKQAMEALRRQVADLAIQAAERLIQRTLDDAKQRELVDQYVKDLAAMRLDEPRRQ